MKENDALRKWLSEVLAVQTGRDGGEAVVELSDGSEAFVVWDGECLLACSSDEEGEQPVYVARIRMVPETD